jgi:hypothetical protein
MGDRGEESIFHLADSFEFERVDQQSVVEFTFVANFFQFARNIFASAMKMNTSRIRNTDPRLSMVKLEIEDRVSAICEVRVAVTSLVIPITPTTVSSVASRSGRKVSTTSACCGESGFARISMLFRFDANCPSAVEARIDWGTDRLAISPAEVL